MNIQQFLMWERRSRDTIDVKRCYVDVAGDLIGGLLLSQVIYWHLPDEHGNSRLRVYHDGYEWLAKKREDWWYECRISPKQFDRAADILEKKDLVFTHLYRFAGSPTKHIRLNWDGLFKALEALPDNVLPQRSKSNSHPDPFLPKGENPGSSPKVKMDFSQSGSSITETPAETTPENTLPLPPETGEPDKRENRKSNSRKDKTNPRAVGTNPRAKARTEQQNQGESIHESDIAVMHGVSQEVPIAQEVIAESSITHEVKSSAAEVEVISSVRKFDAALGVVPREQYQTLQQRMNPSDWIPDGPWKVDGKLHADFIQWKAQRWQQKFGGDIHGNRTNVLLHLKKDPINNLSIAWEEYQEVVAHRLAVAGVTDRSGGVVNQADQQYLITHATAVMSPMPEEMRTTTPKVSKAIAEYLPDVAGMATISSQIPEGGTNPDAYRVFQPSPIDPEESAQNIKRLAEMVRGKFNRLPKPEPEAKPQTYETHEQLNADLVDPVLRPTLQAKAKEFLESNPWLTPDYDEQGLISYLVDF